MPGRGVTTLTILALFPPPVPQRIRYGGRLRPERATRTTHKVNPHRNLSSAAALNPEKRFTRNPYNRQDRQLTH